MTKTELNKQIETLKADFDFALAQGRNYSAAAIADQLAGLLRELAKTDKSWPIVFSMLAL